MYIDWPTFAGIVIGLLLSIAVCLAVGVGVLFHLRDDLRQYIKRRRHLDSTEE